MASNLPPPIKKKVIFLCVLAALLLVNAVVGYRLQSKEEETGENSQIIAILKKTNLLLEVFQEVHGRYLEREGSETKQLFTAAIKEMMSRLDPYSYFMTPADYQANLTMDRDTSDGIGVKVYFREGILTVSSVLPNTPAAVAGLMSGDQILAVNGKPLRGERQGEMMGKVQGTPGSEVTITVRRPQGEEEEKTWDLTLVRQTIEKSSVDSVHVIQGTRTGFLRIDSFTNPTPTQFRKAILELQDQGIDSLILDLRGNPGGLVPSCVAVLSCLLPKDLLVNVTEYRNGEVGMAWFTEESPVSLPPEIPIVVLGDRGSASCAELAISCLRDHHRAAFVGDRTYGKALIQTVRQLSGGNAISLTVAQDYTKEHSPIQGKGIRPDFPDPLTRQQYMDIYSGKPWEEIDQKDPNIQTALRFFAQGAQWPVYQGNPEGDYEDILPHWRRDAQGQYKEQDFMPFSPETENPETEDAPGEGQQPTGEEKLPTQQENRSPWPFVL